MDSNLAFSYFDLIDESHWKSVALVDVGSADRCGGKEVALVSDGEHLVLSWARIDRQSRESLVVWPHRAAFVSEPFFAG